MNKDNKEPAPSRKNRRGGALVALGSILLIGAGWFILNSGSGSLNNEGAEIQNGAGAKSAAKEISDLDRLSAHTLADYDGRAVSLASFKGKPLIVNTWAVWCPFCRAELPDFAALQEELGEQATVIAIDRAEPLAKVKGFTDELGVTGRLTFLIDPSDNFYRDIGGFSMPETVFFDAEGMIVFHKRGPLTLEEMRSAAERYSR